MTEPLPWLAAPLAAALANQRGHATLVHAAAGIGALEFALGMARGLLCEGPDPSARPCGHCGSCRLFESRVHPDLFVLLPEALRRTQGWLLADDRPEGDDARRKPSKQIRIDEVRVLIDWSHNTSSRGRGKVAVLHPADTMNLQSASALLKTLEEPPAGTRLLLTTADPAWLLPTVRSRCQHLRLPPPGGDEAAAWLAGQGVDGAAMLLAACDGRPLDALALHAAGITASAWSELPRALSRGHAGGLSGWPLPQAIDALQKLCHDAMARSVGAATRYFSAESVPAGGSLPALVAWSRELARVARHAEHPWSEALLIESLVAPLPAALAPTSTRRAGTGGLATLPR